MKKQLKYSIYLHRIIQMTLGVLFVVSGFVKGVDPVGVSYKVTEYLELFGLGFFKEWALGLAVLLCAAEIFIGLILLSGVYRKISSLLALLFLLVFTIITFYLVVSPSREIQECGCFGDAFKLTNTETFCKNIFFVTLSAIYFFGQIKNKGCVGVPSSSNKQSVYLSIYLVIIASMIPVISILYLPPFDFLPFNRGINILKNIRKESVKSTDEILLIYKNKKSGETKKFNLNDSTWRDSSTWEYVDMDMPEVEHENYLSKFVVMDGEGVDCSSVVFDNSGYNFIIVARNIDNLRDEDFRKSTPLYQLYLNKSINLYLFTSSELDKTNEKLSSYGLPMVKAYNVDEVVLKSMIRNDRGVMLVSDRVIAGKWNLKLDSFRNLNKSNLERLKKREKHILTNYWVTISSLVLVLIVLVMVGKYFKNKERRVTEKK